MKLSTSRKILVAILAASYIGAFSTLLLGAFSTGKIIALPALVLSGWLFFGHFITLDDDMPGEWSNPEGSRKTWYMSIASFFSKLLLFAVAVYLFGAQAGA
jgi:hypothetical protein